MKSLLQCTVESSSNNKASLRQVLKRFLKDKVEDLSTYDRDENELVRAKFGSDENMYDLVVQAFKDRQNVYISDVAEIIGRDKGASSKYRSLTVSIDGEDYYVANISTDKALLRSKDLNPSKLGLANKGHNIYTSFTQLKDATIHGLQSLKDKHPEIYDGLRDIIDIIENSDFESSGSFSFNDVNDFFSSDDDGKLTFSIENIDLSKILDGDIANIEKDFGEILGPLVFFRLFDDVSCVFPESQSEPMVDYYINGNKVSAKQLGGGGRPAGSEIMLRAKANLEEIENNVDDLTASEMDAMYDEKEKEFIKKVASTYELSIFKQQCALINEFALTDAIKDLLGFSIKNLESYKDLVYKLDNKFENEDIEEFFTKFYNLLDYTSAKTYTPSYIADNYYEYSMTDKTKWGILFYPLYITAINKINEIYGSRDDDEEDVISSVIQKSIQLKQVYFGIRKNKMKLEVISSGVHSWKVVPGGMSTNNIGNSKLSIEMKR